MSRKLRKPKNDLVNTLKNDFRKKIENISSLNEVVVLSKTFFSDSKYYLFDRIKELFDLFDEDEDSQISIGSLKSMLAFLFLINDGSYWVLRRQRSGVQKFIFAAMRSAASPLRGLCKNKFLHSATRYNTGWI